jgi:hypothetical protein
MVGNINPYRKKKSKITKPTMLRRTPQQMEHDRVFISKYYTRGYSYRDITKLLNEHLVETNSGYVVTESTVYNEIRIILVDWKRQRFETIEDYIQIELRKLDKIETELWEAWENSKKGKKRVKIKGGQVDASEKDAVGGKLQNRVAETSAGDPKFLDLLLAVQEKRARLLGYDTPTKVQIQRPADVVPGEKVLWAEMPDNLVTDLASAIQDQLAKASASKMLDTAEGYVDFTQVPEEQSQKNQEQFMQNQEPEEEIEEHDESDEIESDGITF